MARGIGGLEWWSSWVYKMGLNQYFMTSVLQHPIPVLAIVGRPNVGKNSTARYQVMQSQLASQQPHIRMETLRSILATPYPQGVCCHYYNQGMGTLWSVLFDPMKLQMEVCFGSPHANTWHTFSLDDAPGIQTYTAELPDEDAPQGFW